MSRREDVVKALEDIDEQIGSLRDLDEYLKKEARARLRRVVEIINMQNEEAVLEWQKTDFSALSDDEEAKSQEQLILVLREVEQLEEDKRICENEDPWDSMYTEHEIKRQRMARLVVTLTDDGARAI